MTVYLVGAGPGDPGLLTVRGAEVLREADTVVHDRLSDQSLLELAPETAERIDVGKRPGGPIDQERINSLLVERGRRGERVIRLKGGDPFVFGRGGEEAQALLDSGVPFEVVPGVTAAVGVPAYAGVPLTHRGLSTSFTVVTGHSRQELDEAVDWGAIARSAGTLVVLMGVAHRSEIAERLLKAGLPAATPVVVVCWGTRPSQRSVRTTLAELGKSDVAPPATIVIGPVASLNLAWFEQRPLFGWQVVVTRARGQASLLSRRLREAGADPIELPVIALAPPSDNGASLQRALQRLSSYVWVVFTSANAVGSLFNHIGDARAFGKAKIAAIGPGTAQALAAYHVVADLVPERFIAEGLLEVFPAPCEGGRVLLPRAEKARDVLEKGLQAAGWIVEQAVAYRTETVRPPTETKTALRCANAVTFTSSSTVTGFLEAVGVDFLPPVVACIGPVTASTARDNGLAVDVVADVHSIDGLVEALSCFATRQARHEAGS